MVPEGMAYAGIVGVPPIMGLYTIVPPLIAYALLGTSRLLVVGPDTATGLISALTVGAIAAQGTADFNPLTSTLAILIGTLFSAVRRAAHGLGSRLHSDAGDAGLHRGPRLRHDHRPGAASARHRGYLGQLFHQALVYAAASAGGRACTGADRSAQPHRDAGAAPSRTAHTRGAGRRGRGDDTCQPASRQTLPVSAWLATCPPACPI